MSGELWVDANDIRENWCHHSRISVVKMLPVVKISTNQANKQIKYDDNNFDLGFIVGQSILVALSKMNENHKF